MGLVGPCWWMSAISCPLRFVLVVRRCRIQAFRLLIVCLSDERVGSGVVGGSVADDGRISPNLHWPQKAVQAHANMTESSGSDMLRYKASVSRACRVIGGCLGLIDVGGVILWTPLST